jgi:Na+(H+)/acetate symporter ActP
LPHILIRYYTVKDQASARKSTVVGIASIGFFYILTLFLGLGAMTSGRLDVTDNNMSAPLLARSFGELPFAVISAIAFTTVLGTVSGLIMAASGAVAHDLLANFFQIEMNDHTKVRAGKLTAVVVGIIAMALGILFQGMNVSFLVGWAFNWRLPRTCRHWSCCLLAGRRNKAYARSSSACSRRLPGFCSPPSATRTFTASTPPKPSSPSASPAS